MTDIGNSYGRFARSSADLCGFMLVCEYGTLSAAAKQLKVTQPSLSQRMKNLELVLGQQLFVRKSTGVVMTAAGQNLYRMLKEPFESTVEKFDEYLEQPTADRVVLSVDHAFAYFWLLERLPQLREELGTTDICIITSQVPLKPQEANADITIYMSSSDKAVDGSELLFRERVSAVCSKGFRQDNAKIKEPVDLTRLGIPLLHLNSPTGDTPWIDWVGWFDLVGANVRQATSQTEFNTYEMVVRAAQGGQGVALGWHVLIDDLLVKGKLVRLFPRHVETNVGYYIRLTNIRQKPKVLNVRNWIVEQASEHGT